MTGTIIPWPVAGREPVATETHAALATPPPRFKRVTLSTGTWPAPEVTEIAEPTPVDRIYPHLFDQDQQAGQALLHIRSAVGYMQATLDAFGEPDLDAAGASLAQLATALSAAYPLTEFNPSLGGVVAYVRRAVLAAPVTDISRSGLNALQFVLQGISDNPMLDLDDAADAIDRLEREGWLGEHELADKIVAALLGDSEFDEDEEVQIRLFSDAVSPSP